MKLFSPTLFCPALLGMLGLAAASASAQTPADFPELTVTVCETNAIGAGRLFLEVTDGPAETGHYVMMLGKEGAPVWWQDVTNQMYDFKVLPDGRLHYANIYQPHSWTGGGDCTHEILSPGFTPLETVTAGNGYVADAHDFQLLPNGHTLLLGYYRTAMDVSKYVSGGYPNALVAGAVIQELDAQRNVVFQWRTWDHFTIPTYFPPAAFTNKAARNPVIDAFHLNTVTLDTDGNLLVSNFGMDVWKLSRQTGQILWRLGGPGNQFTFAGVNPLLALGHFSGHTLTRLDNGNLLIYCNADQQATRSSKVYEYRLDETNKIATLVWSYAPPTNYYAWHYGSVQRLANGNTLIGWGGANIMPGIGGVTNQAIPACTEVAPDGRIVFELWFNDPRVASYRAYRMPFPPEVAPNTSWYTDIMADNSYEFDQTGVGMTALAGGGSYNQLIVTREDYAPVNPQFAAKAPRLLPVRVNFTQWGIPELAADLELDAASFHLENPDKITIYCRPRIGQGAFTPLPTVFNPVTHKVCASANMSSDSGELAEFALGYADLASLALPPILAAVVNDPGLQTEEVVGQLPAEPGKCYPVNQELPVGLAWSPQGFASAYRLQISTNADFSGLVLELTNQLAAAFAWPEALPDTAYWYRVATVNDAGTSDWAVGAFVTQPPAIALTAPKGGASWQRGLAYFIQWQDNVAEQVIIDLYQKGNWVKTLATNASSGAYKWTVGLDLAPGNDYSIQIRSATNAAVFAASAPPFLVDVPGIDFLVPNADGTCTVRWSGTSSGVYVEFAPALAPDQWQTIAGPITAAGWTNTSPSLPAGFYRLRLP